MTATEIIADLVDQGVPLKEAARQAKEQLARQVECQKKNAKSYGNNRPKSAVLSPYSGWGNGR